jgi:hypothetical protein
MEPRLMAAQGPAGSAGADARAAVTALYQAHAVGLIGLAVVMIGDRHAAEDVVQTLSPGCIAAGITSTSTGDSATCATAFPGVLAIMAMPTYQR